MTQRDRARRRWTFDEAAGLYDRARPGYPAALFDDLVELTGIGPGSRVLEIGSGTGQATGPLAERGCRVVAVELGPRLAAVARRNLLLTYSGHRALDPPARAALLDCIAHLIDTAHGGRVTKRHLTELRVAPTLA
jgi:SAM-dependent methyltransferase